MKDQVNSSKTWLDKPPIHCSTGVILQSRWLPRFSHACSWNSPVLIPHNRIRVDEILRSPLRISNHSFFSWLLVIDIEIVSGASKTAGRPESIANNFASKSLALRCYILGPIYHLSRKYLQIQNRILTASYSVMSHPITVCGVAIATTWWLVSRQIPNKEVLILTCNHRSCISYLYTSYMFPWASMLPAQRRINSLVHWFRKLCWDQQLLNIAGFCLCEGIFPAEIGLVQCTYGSQHEFANRENEAPTGKLIVHTHPAGGLTSCLRLIALAYENKGQEIK